ncbi:MAG: 1-acyl-sn-glycerol-3-phosphate acyltransferase [Rhodobacterales bacterium]|nr:MAG: 1-acyl-sn-glycerol-3-phosphate acyltransferase [Rhodobacterales bacterium]
MSETWGIDQPPQGDPKPGWGGRLIATVRAIGIVAVIGTGLVLLLLLRQIERPVFGLHRPWTPWITQTVCRATLALMGLRLRIEGTPLRGPGAVVANHASWLDIFVLNAVQRVYFVSKAEVKGWPGIGVLARATGTIFIRRDRREAAAQAQLLTERLGAGHRLLVFPEGTSSDARRVLPFKPALFASFLNAPVEGMQVQPVSVVYSPPKGRDPRFYGWWGDAAFGDSLLQVLAQWPQGQVTVVQHTPLMVAEFSDRKALARQSEEAVRRALEERGVAAPAEPSSPDN